MQYLHFNTWESLAAKRSFLKVVPLYLQGEYYIFIEWSCSINKISAPSKIFCNDEVTVRKAENLFTFIQCIIYNEG